MTRPLLFFASLFIGLVVACEDDRVPSGVEATITVADSSGAADFADYNGMVHFIPETSFTGLNDSTWAKDKVQFDSAKCTNGKVSTFLEPGTYVAEPGNFFSCSFPGKFTVRADHLKEVEIRFQNCH